MATLGPQLTLKLSNIVFVKTWIEELQGSQYNKLDWENISQKSAVTTDVHIVAKKTTWLPL